eukprot:TRINITY_DN38514_c0_g1_i1.p2 TRINITY_DN38514_c0_g1~~TRINITY_DN38514_c0_g1_i1.p2  ORF type:complete len:372 (+),score=84.05 TRINITY_DN38514_c0_g1_i1:152-1267(+)
MDNFTPPPGLPDDYVLEMWQKGGTEERDFPRAFYVPVTTPPPEAWMPDHPTNVLSGPTVSGAPSAPIPGGLQNPSALRPAGWGVPPVSYGWDQGMGATLPSLSSMGVPAPQLPNIMQPRPPYGLWDDIGKSPSGIGYAPQGAMRSGMYGVPECASGAPGEEVGEEYDHPSMQQGKGRVVTLDPWEHMHQREESEGDSGGDEYGVHPAPGKHRRVRHPKEPRPGTVLLDQGTLLALQSGRLSKRLPLPDGTYFNPYAHRKGIKEKIKISMEYQRTPEWRKRQAEEKKRELEEKKRKEKEQHEKELAREARRRVREETRAARVTNKEEDEEEEEDASEGTSVDGEGSSDKPSTPIPTRHSLRNRRPPPQPDEE